MRITEQHVWNFLFLVLFVSFIILGDALLASYSYRSILYVDLFDITLITLASFRFIRLVIYDKIFAFFRDQFWNASVVDGEVVLTKPSGGPRRTLADLLSCPWCFGIWAAATVTFFYFLTPYAFFPILFMAIAGIASLLQLLSNLIGWHAEKAKKSVEG